MQWAALCLLVWPHALLPALLDMAVGTDWAGRKQQPRSVGASGTQPLPMGLQAFPLPLISTSLSPCINIHCQPLCAPPRTVCAGLCVHGVVCAGELALAAQPTPLFLTRQPTSPHVVCSPATITSSVVAGTTQAHTCTTALTVQGIHNTTLGPAAKQSMCVELDCWVSVPALGVGPGLVVLLLKLLLLRPAPPCARSVPPQDITEFANCSGMCQDTQPNTCTVPLRWVGPALLPQA